MKKIVAFTAGYLLIASVSHAVTSMNCSDVSADLRVNSEKKKNTRKTKWFYKGDRYNDDNVEAKLNYKSKRTQIMGDEYNGYFLTTAEFNTGRERINQTMLCQNVDTDRTKVVSPAMPKTFMPAFFSKAANCSNANGKVRKAAFGGWEYNGNPVTESQRVMHNQSMQRDMGDGYFIYEIVFRSKTDNTETVEEIVMCK